MNIFPVQVDFDQPQWTEIPSIVKSTFQVLVQALQQAGKIVINQIQTGKKKEELANFREVKEELANRVSFQDLNNSLAPFNQMLRAKASFEDLKAVEMKADQSGDLEQIRQEFMRRWQDTASQQDLEYVKRALQLKANLHQTKKSINQKASKQSVSKALAKKANKDQTDTILAGKAEKRELSQVQAALQIKIDHDTFDQFKRGVAEKIDQLCLSLTKLVEDKERLVLEKVDGRLEKIEKTLCEIGREAQKVREIPIIQADLKTKSTIKDHKNLEYKTNTELERINKIIKQQISNWQSFNQQIQAMKSENQKKQRTLGSQLAQTNLSVQKKFSSVMTAIETYKSQSLKKQNILGQNLRQLQIAITESQRKFLNLLQYKALKSQVQLIQQSYSKQQDLLQISKAFQSSHLRFSQEIHRKIGDLQSETYQISNLKSELSQLQLQIDQKSNHTQLKSKFAKLSNQLQLLTQKSNSLQHLIQFNSSNCIHDTYIDQLKFWQVRIKNSLQQKANVNQIQDTLTAKAYFKQISHSLQNLQELLQKKVQLTDFSTRLQDQAYINQILCKESSVGRWVWRSGHTLKGVIKWDSETVNTYPQGFQWNSGSSSVNLLVPGIYQVNFGFYSRKEPHVSLILNSEVAYTYPAKLPKKPSQITKGKSGVEFIAINAKSRISFKILTETPVEGFFGLKKL